MNARIDFRRFRARMPFGKVAPRRAAAAMMAPLERVGDFFSHADSSAEPRNPNASLKIKIANGVPFGKPLTTG